MEITKLEHTRHAVLFLLYLLALGPFTANKTKCVPDQEVQLPVPKVLLTV